MFQNIVRSWKISLLVCLAITYSSHSIVFAQKSKKQRMERSPIQVLDYDTKTYLPTIQSVQFHSLENETDLPIYNLNDQIPLKLTFDDLRGDIRNLYFSMEHCDFDWKSSHLSALEYSEGFNEDRITKYWISRNTLQPYTHYEFNFPTKHISPKIPGNYLLKVYEDANKKRLILTHRFFVVKPDFKITSKIVPSSSADKRFTNQKINLEIDPAGYVIQIPERELKVRVLQNQRPDNHQTVIRPSGILNKSFIYEDPKTLDFQAGNEFLSVDLRSFQLSSERMASISRDSTNRIELFTDQIKAGSAYAEVYDENGHFFIRNSDRLNADDETDYGQVTFSLKKPQGVQLTDRQGIYLVGGFNFFRIDERYKLIWNSKLDRYQVTVPLKQGLYDYQYLIVDENSSNTKTSLDGNHYQTDNSYQILVYYRQPGTTWDGLYGFQEIENENRKLLK